MDIVKVISVFMIVFVLVFGGVLLFHASRLEEDIREEMSRRKRAGKIGEDDDDEV